MFVWKFGVWMATWILQEIESVHVVPVQGTRDNVAQHLSNHNLVTRRPRWRIVWTWSARAAVHSCPLVAPVVSVGVNVTKKHPRDGKHDLFQGLAATTDHDAWTLSFCSLDDLMKNMWSKQWTYLKASTNCEGFNKDENEVLHCRCAYLALYGGLYVSWSCSFNGGWTASSTPTCCQPSLLKDLVHLKGTDPDVSGHGCGSIFYCLIKVYYKTFRSVVCCSLLNLLDVYKH